MNAIILVLYSISNNNAMKFYMNVLLEHFTIFTFICDQICQKGSYIRTVSRHTFHRHLLATLMHQQDMCLPLLKVEQSAFTQAFFSSLSGVHECSGLGSGSL